MNHPELTLEAAQVAREMFGPTEVQEIPPTMGAEDMGLYLEKVPGTFLFLGIMNEAKGVVHPQHHPEYDVDDQVLPRGSALLAVLALRFLSKLS